MKLFTKAILKQLPKLYSQNKTNPIAYVKLFCPWGRHSWFITEYDPEQRLAFGLTYGDEAELGYISIKELESICSPYGLRIERDRHFKPSPLSQCNDPCGISANPYADEDFDM